MDVKLDKWHKCHVEKEILKDIIKVCEEVRKDEARTQKFFSVKDKTRYKTWTAQDYT